MTTKRIFFILILCLSLLTFVGCKTETDYEKSNHQKVLDLIEIGFQTGNSNNYITKNLDLPNYIDTNIAYEEIAWTSNNPKVIDANGKVERQSEDVEVILAVTVVINSVGREKLFFLNVIGESNSNNIDYMITFDTDGGTLIETQVIQKDKLAVKPNPPIKNGYNFLGWFIDNQLFNFNNPINTHLTIYARWEIKEGQQTYSVIFETNGGSPIISESVLENSLINKPIDPIRSGDQFAGWFKDFELLSPWNFSIDKVDSDVTLYASWILSDTPLISGRTLLFNDEFNGDSLDLAKWDYQNGTGREFGLWWWGNDEKQYYKPDNIEVSNGSLKIHAKVEQTYDPLANATMQYSSSKIVTLGKHSQTYGRIEARIKAPVGQGFWPAFWMMPVNNTYGNGWPHNGEIDIVELRGRLPHEVTSAFHFQGPGGHQYLHGKTNIPNNGRTDEFHTYGVEWSEGRLDFFVDDYIYHSRHNAWYQSPKPFNHDFYIILNLAIGGHFDGHLTPKLDDFPANLEIDYVRSYAQ